MTPIKTAPRRASVKAPSRRINSSTFSQLRSTTSTTSSSISGECSKLSGFLDKVITTSIIAAFFLPLLYFTGLLAQGAGFEKVMIFSLLTLVGTIAWVAKGIFCKDLKIKKTPVCIPIVAFLVMAIISTVTSVGLKDSLIGTYGSPSKSLAVFIVFALFYNLVVNNINKEQAKKIFMALMLSASITLVYSLLQLFGLFIVPVESTKINTFNPIGSLSGLVAFVSMLLPILVILFAQAKLTVQNPKNIAGKRIALGVLILISLLILVILSGFTYWLVVIASTLFILGFALSKSINTDKKGLVMIILVLLLTVSVYTPTFFKDSEGNSIKIDLASKIGITSLPAEVSLTRGAAWDIAKKSIKESALFGSGPSTFYYSFNKFKGTGFNNTNLWNIKFDSSSGLFFELISTMGILGVIALFAILISALVSVFSSLKKGSEEEQVYMFALFIGLVTIVGLSFFYGFNSALIVFSVLIGVLALAFASVVKGGDQKVITIASPSEKGFSLSLIGFSGVIGLVSLAFVFMGAKIVIADSLALKSVKQTEIAEKVAKLEKAAKFAPFQDAYQVALSNNYVTLVNQSAKTEDTIAANDLLIKSIDAGKLAVDIAPNKSDNHESLALIYENAFYFTNEALEWSEKSYQKVINLEPDSPTPYLRLGLISMARARAETTPEEQKHYVDKAIEYYNESIGKKINLASAYYGKSVAHEALGDIDGAIQSLTSAAYIDQNPSFVFELGRLYLNKGASSAASQGGVAKDDLIINPGDSDNQQVNESLKTAEQLFLSVLLKNQNHPNARYSLALLYKNTGDTQKAKVMVQSLLKIITDEAQKEAIKKQFPGLY